MHILHLDSAITGAASVSRDLTAQIVARLTAAHPDATVTRRDLNDGPAMIDPVWYRAVREGTDAPDAEEQRRIATSADLLAELRAADTVVIGAPLYNFGVPATLKTWFDHVALAGESFRYTAEGPEGLLTGKRAILGFASGGTTAGGPGDFVTPWLRHMLGFIGITDVTVVAADGLALDREAALARARAAIAALAA